MRRRTFLELLAAASVPGMSACRRSGGGPLTPGEVVYEPGLPQASSEEVASASSVPDRYAHLVGFAQDVHAPTAAELAEHRQRVQFAMQRAEVELVVLEPGPDMEYVSGVRWGRSERPFLLALPASGDPVWICPAFEEAKAREQLGPDAKVRVWQEHEDPFASLPPTQGSVLVGSDTRGFVFAGVQAAVRGGSKRVRLEPDLVGGVRLLKTPAEITRLRRANEATKAALAAAAAITKDGLRQSELAAEVAAAQKAAGLTDVWVLALFGPAASFPHGTHEDRTLRPGDVVLVDTGGGLHGYRSDITRTWVLGEPSKEVQRAWETVAAAQAAALATMAPGVACADVDAAARAVIAEAGYGTADGYEAFTHRLGHGIGLRVHEPPYLVTDNELRLQPGMTMSNEPGIYLPGRFGIRIEDIVAITPSGAEVFGEAVTRGSGVPSVS